MEKDTVLLNVKTYDRLKECEKKANEPKKHTIYIKNSMFTNFRAETDEDAVKLLSEDLKAANERIEELEKKCKDLPKEITVNDIKNMSYWEFRKWRKS
jgi:predicted RNase H-like nuclease (RuvC/YqgF family)